MADKKVKLVLTPPQPPELGVPEEIRQDPTLNLLYNILVRLTALEERIMETFVDVTDYLPVEDTVDKDNPKEIDIVKELGRPSKSGFIRNDGTEDIYIQINGGEKYRIGKSEQFSWGPDNNRLVVSRIYITTNSSTPQSFRMVAT